MIEYQHKGNARVKATDKIYDLCVFKYTKYKEWGCMPKEKEFEYFVHDDTGLKWEDLTEEEKRKLDEFDKSSKMAEFMEKLKEEYGL